jgi:hypothetical protein
MKSRLFTGIPKSLQIFFASFNGIEREIPDATATAAAVANVIGDGLDVIR